MHLFEFAPYRCITVTMAVASQRRYLRKIFRQYSGKVYFTFSPLFSASTSLHIFALRWAQHECRLEESKASAWLELSVPFMTSQSGDFEPCPSLHDNNTNNKDNECLTKKDDFSMTKDAYFA